MMEGVDGKLIYEIFRDLLLLLFLVWTASGRRQQATKDSVAELKKEKDEELKAHDKRLNRHRDQLTRVETVIEGMPSHQDIEKLHERVGRVKTLVSRTNTDVATALEAVNGLKRGVDLLTEHHINKAKGDKS